MSTTLCYVGTIGGFGGRKKDEDDESMETPEEAAFADATRNQLNPLDEEMVSLHMPQHLTMYVYAYY